MKIFISHSTKDKNLALILSAFLESIDYSIEVFCSSQTGSIKVGRDFVAEITKELKGGDVFIPVLSNHFYESKFCMVELGFAYSILSNDMESEADYVYPICIPPVKKAEALVDTPLARLQVFSINDIVDMQVYFKAIADRAKLSLGSGFNKRMSGFIYDVNKIIFDTYDIKKDARILLCKSNNVPGEDGDYLQYGTTSDGNGYIVTFKAKPYQNSVSYPDFLSFVFKYADKINLYEIANIFEDAQLIIEINNYTNSISKIVTEIKYSDNNQILDRRIIDLGEGLNKIIIPLRELRSEALKQVSEICFVVSPSAYIEDEGTFYIKQLEIGHK